MANNKTIPTGASVSDFIEAIEDDVRRRDAKQVCEMIAQVTGEEPVMWGNAIVGFGQYSYLCGKSTEIMCKTGFSPRKAETVVYFIMGFDNHKASLEKLGKHKHSKSCLNLKDLSKIDFGVLRDMVKKEWELVSAKYG